MLLGSAPVIVGAAVRCTRMRCRQGYALPPPVRTYHGEGLALCEGEYEGENVISVYWVTSSADHCCMGFLPCNCMHQMSVYDCVLPGAGSF